MKEKKAKKDHSPVFTAQTYIPGGMIGDNQKLYSFLGETADFYSHIKRTLFSDTYAQGNYRCRSKTLI